MEARKLPSGSWRVRVYSHTEQITQPDGTIKEKKVYKSFTCSDPSKKGKRICEAEAAAWATGKETNKACSLTLGQAMDEYIASRENVLSPRSIMEYRNTRINHCQSLMNIRVDNIAQEDIQRAINIEALKLSPKSVRNIHGLISATLKVFRPEMALNTSLPQKVRPEIYVPSDDEIQRLLASVRGTDMELPILLAAFGPMRRGEICALDASDINGNVVHVCKNMVKTKDNTWIIRHPKTYAGDRYIDYPDFVAMKWKRKSGRIVELTPNNITDRFRYVLIDAKLPHFRFHDLRHYSASIQHALGIPDSYIMQRGGWGNDGVLKSVYRHTMESKAKEMNALANSYFSSLYATKYDTK